MTTTAPAKPCVLCLVGPTASGKTRVALELARRYPLEIISVDSALVYRGLDIGSGKPDRSTLTAIPHHLVDIRDPAEPFSAADFRTDALAAIADISSRGRIPLLAGGTMLYFKVLRDGLAEMPEADASIRASINQLAREQGWVAVHKRLAQVDPEAASRLRPSDSQRLQRAMEVYETSGITLTEYHRRQQLYRDELPFSLRFVAMYPPERAMLHARIEARFMDMLAQGLLDEVRSLKARSDLHKQLPAIRSVGYRQVWEHLEGLYDHDTMVAKAVAATRQLAKRQYTWLRKWPELEVIDSEAPGLVDTCSGIMDSCITGS